MDGLKKNLHFVVFGAGLLLGVIFLFVGISMRGGTEEKLDQSLNSLGTLSPPSEGDVNAAKQVRTKFDSSLSEAQSALKGRGKALTQGFDPSKGPDEFYSDDATGKLRELDDRFAAMEKEPALPDPLTGRYRIDDRDRERDNTFWKDRDSEMANLRQEQVKEYWIRLRIMEEVATVCEKLLESGAGDGMGVRLIAFNFEALTTVGNQDEMSPWVVMPWSVQLECSPNFSVLLLSELTSPSKLTMGDDARRGFPNLLTNYQTQLKGRPEKAKFLIDKDYKKQLGHSEDLDPSTGQGQKVIEDVTKELEEELVILQPVKVGMRLQAAMYNEQWRPMVEPVEE